MLTHVFTSTKESSLSHIFPYVDDILIVSNDQNKKNRVKSELTKLFKVKDLGTAKYCLGIEIRHDEEKVCLSQRGYIKEVLKRFGMSDCKPVDTPIALGIKLTKSSDVEENNVENHPYQQLIEALMYAGVRHCARSKCTQPI